MAGVFSLQRQGRGVVLSDLLRELVEASADFEGAVLVSLEGLVIAAAWPSEDRPEHLHQADDSEIGAVACRAFEQSDRATDLLARGDLERLILSGSKGNMIITRAGSDALCVALLKTEAKLGVASFAAMRISQQIENVLG